MHQIKKSHKVKTNMGKEGNEIEIKKDISNNRDINVELF